MKYELIMIGLWIDYRWVMSGLQSYGWKSMWMNSIHHVIIFDVDVCEFFWQWFSELVFGNEPNVPNFIGTFNNGVLTFQKKKWAI